MNTAAQEYIQATAPVVPAEKKQPRRANERPISPFMFPMWYRFQITSAS